MNWKSQSHNLLHQTITSFGDGKTTTTFSLLAFCQLRVIASTVVAKLQSKYDILCFKHILGSTIVCLTRSPKIDHPTSRSEEQYPIVYTQPLSKCSCVALPLIEDWLHCFQILENGSKKSFVFTFLDISFNESWKKRKGDRRLWNCGQYGFHSIALGIELNGRIKEFPLIYQREIVFTTHILCKVQVSEAWPVTRPLIISFWI